METILWRSTVTQSKYFVIEWVDIDFGNGKQSVFERVTFNYKEGEPRGGVTICGYDRTTQEIILISQFQVALERATYLLPRGGLLQDKTALESAQQEFVEETWYVSSTRIELPTVYVSPWYFTQHTTLFLAIDATLSEGEHEGDEIEQTVSTKVLLSDAIQMIMRGEIVDARTVAGIFMLQQYLMEHPDL